MRSPTNRQKQYWELVNAGLCVHCRQPVPEDHKICQKCRDYLYPMAEARRKTLTEQGICYVCGLRPAVTGRKSCEVCLAADRERSRKRRDKKKSSSLCPSCGFQPITEGQKLCDECHTRRVEYQRQRRKDRKENGLCTDCGKPAGPQSKVFCEYHWRQYNQKMHEHRFSGNRAKALERDNHHCCLCPNTTGRLHVHHIDLDPNNNELANLITLCQRCHNAITDMTLCLDPMKIIEFVKEHYIKSESLARR